MHISRTKHLFVLTAFAAAAAAILLLITSLAEVPDQRRVMIEIILASPLALYGIARRRRWQR